MSCTLKGTSPSALIAAGHNHFWLRRQAIERALLEEDWSEAERHADALLLRMADEPLAWKFH